MEDVVTPQLIAVGTRLPSDIYEKFSALCEADRRSMSARLLLLVEKFIEENTPKGE